MVHGSKFSLKRYGYSTVVVAVTRNRRIEGRGEMHSQADTREVYENGVMSPINRSEVMCISRLRTFILKVVLELSLIHI